MMSGKKLNVLQQWVLMIPVNSQQQTYPRHEGFMPHPHYFPDNLPSVVGDVQGPDQLPLLIEHNKGERINNSVGIGENSNGLQGIEEKIEGGGEEKETSHKRIKWTDEMVKLLITALSYIGEENVAAQPFRCKSRGLLTKPKPGKWKAISKVMVQRGYHVTPHQCEDKFKDLNKKFRRLNDLLGRGTACKVVENPKLIGLMDLSNEAVLEVMRLLSCKQLFFQELCSYHNGNRLFLPHDQSLQHSLKLALKAKGKCSQDAIHELPAKRMRKLEDHGLASFRSAFDCNRKLAYPPPNEQSKPVSLTSKGGEGDKLPNNWMRSCFLQLEEQKLQIQQQRLELEKLIMDNEQEDLELEKMRLENKFMKLENQRLAFKLKCWKKAAYKH
ncbi:hypothetical protein ACH5RR_022480 [Cinchona calisaya]|uniref:Myb/SANT-like DNA-binding domain-containing protein n=1 Tax=Cinchona calisaya TaxID=153742 RepID=A0ABD2Z7Y1_9GENT